MNKLLPIYLLLTMFFTLPLTLVADDAFDGGVISLMNGTTETEICVGDGIADPIMVMLMDAEGPYMTWVVTDTTGKIVAIQESNTFDFEGAGAGTCVIWHMSYKDIVGDFKVGMNKDNVQGWLDYSNPITVVRRPIAAATISVNGTDQIDICIDGIPDPFEVTYTGGVGRYSKYLVTDEDLNILAITSDNEFDLEGAGEGVCLIWRLTFNNIFGNVVGLNAGNLGGCFMLSNPITVTRTAVEGGTLELEDGGTELAICAGDGVENPFTPILTEGSGDSSAWIITDQNLNILGVPGGPTFDLEGAGDGVCLLWNVSYNGDIDGLTVGANAADISGCYALSNAITVTRDGVSGGTISLIEGGDSLTICTGDGTVDLFTLEISDATGENQSWVITDEDLNILGLPNGPTFNLEDAGAGVCLVWNLSFNGDIEGAEVGMNAGNLQGCFSLSNPVTVVRNAVAPASIQTTLGLTEFSICAGDGAADIFTVEISGGEGESSAWIITDQDLNILGTPQGPTFNLEDAGNGTCLLWYATFSGMLSGVEVGSNAADISGCYVLSNPITIEREGVEAGTISLEDGGDEIEICAGDGVSDAFTISLEGATGENSAWVITDENLNILGVQDSDTFDLEGAGEGVCLIWNVSFNGDLEGAETGQNAGDLSGCLALSNSIRVVRNAVSSASISLEGGDTELTICAGDGNADPFTPVVEGGNGNKAAWVITDEELNILGIPDGPAIDLEGAGAGTCLVWYVTYNDTISGLEMGSNAAELSGCFALSNAITVVRNAVEGSVIEIEGGGDSLTICAGDGISDAFSATVEGGSGESSAWVITDGDLNILGLPAGPTFDLEDAGDGVCLLWHININGELIGAEVGMNVANLEGCFALSNPITVIREGVAPANIMIEGGGEEISICAGDGISDMFTAVVEGGEGELTAWIITDENLDILALPEGPSFDLDGAGEGTCLVWYLNYNGEISGLEVDGNAANLSGCFALSNSITVDRSGVEPASISLEDGGTELEICAGDGNSDEFTPILEGATGMNSQWIITDADLNILALPEGPSFDLEGAGSGVCVLWYLSFNGEVSGLEVDSNAADIAGCFALSNGITITRNTVEASTINSDLGTDFSICAGDGVADPFTVTVEGGDGAFTGWIITDTSGNILGLPEGPTFNLEGAGSGVCQVWFYNAVDEFDDIETGDNVSDIEVCFSLSNPITVTRQGVEAPILTLDDGVDSTEICVGDGIPDLIIPNVDGGEGESFTWIITSSDTTVLGMPMAPPFNLEAAGPGTCLVWYLAYNGERPTITIGSKVGALEGCAALSNPVRVIRKEIQAGTIAIASDGTDSLTICAGDDVSDAFDVTLDGNVGENSAWVITDQDLNILGLPDAPPFDLDGAGAGVCLVWHLSFNGEIEGAVVDSNAANLVGCYELSNPITVTRVTEGDPCNDGQLAPEDVDIFPNPSAGSITIKLNVVMHEELNVQVFDAYGQLVMSKFDMRKDDMSMDLQNLDAGVYYFRIQHGEDAMVKEFIKL
ncbi:T9SS type A sorting domain-containing protein [Portibacter marinus]|uniref:T9SS type A sorting domain-containing protein n=1 Tax=Portibacter marinus TaxID=2898660 RepID=UPI001F217449|nr:T9SS type A sorting domain-containing protein [Portibacter marinus]